MKSLIKALIPGPKSKALRKEENKHLAPGLQGFAIKAGIVVKRAKGTQIEDVDGNIFLDLIGGIGVGGIGHSHPTYVSALQKQLELISMGSFTSLPRVNYLKRLSHYLSKLKLTHTQFYSSGAEAVESSLRLAKSYTKKNEFVSFWGGFHGKTLGALSLMGSTYKNHYGPLASGSHCIPYAYCYRCPLSLKYPSCGLACIELGRKQLKMQSTGEVAAIIIEPMQGTAGNIIPPNDFLPAIKELARENDALLIVDEMITGFGRTGKFWGSEHSRIKPDIITLGKQMGGGFPISAVSSTHEISIATPWSAPSGSSSSYGGNPLALCAADVTLQIIENEQLILNAKSMGAYFLEQLKPMEERYPFIGEVRGVGLLLGIEMVRDKKTKEPLSKKSCDYIFAEHLKRGLLSMAYTPNFRIQPAMTIDRDSISHCVAILYEVFDLIKDQKLWLK